MNKFAQSEAGKERKEQKKTGSILKFRTALLATGGNTTGIEVPQTVLEALGQGKRPPVKVRFSGYSYQSRIGIMGGRSLIPVSAAHREASGVKAGDKIEVTVELDTSR